jgi:hypothetical protein
LRKRPPDDCASEEYERKSDVKDGQRVIRRSEWLYQRLDAQWQTVNPEFLFFIFPPFDFLVFWWQQRQRCGKVSRSGHFGNWGRPW